MNAPLHFAFLALAPFSVQSECDPAWLPSFGSAPGVDGKVEALALFDSGFGPELYAAGSFTEVTGIPATSIARWNGTEWSSLPGFANGSIEDLAVYDDGSGPALFVAGSFFGPGGTNASNIAKWDGLQWTALGTGVNGAVTDLEVFDDGSGPALYLAGEFDQYVAASAPFFFTAGGLARWDSNGWAGFDTQMNNDGRLQRLATFDDGSGERLVVGGSFNSLFGQSINSIASWDGQAWSPLGSGIPPSIFFGIAALGSFDDGSGPKLFVGGTFDEAGGQRAQNIARWDGQQWSTAGSFQSLVRHLEVADVGQGPQLFASSGALGESLQSWNGSGWEITVSDPFEWATDLVQATGLNGSVGPAAYVSGLERVGKLNVGSVGLLSSTGWDSLGHSGLGDRVRTLLSSSFEGSNTLYTGGRFLSSNNLSLCGVGRFDGFQWSPLGTGLATNIPADPAQAWSMVVHDDGSGPALFVGGDFDRAGGVPAKSVARWDGSAWSSVGNGPFGPTGVRALVSFDDGTGSKLYAGGPTAGTMNQAIHTWDGASWTPIPMIGTAFQMILSPDGSELFVGGQFSQIAGVPARNIARLDANGWSALGSGVGANNSWVAALAYFDSGSGPELHVGGKFNTAGGNQASHLARWDGSTWSNLAGGASDFVRTLTSHDDGRGPALFAGGDFTQVDGLAAQYFARWDGHAWDAVGSGMDDAVWASGEFEGALFAGGYFEHALDSGDAFLARWQKPCPGPLSFCTPKLSSAGCAAGIGTNQPTAQPVSGAGDYAVTASEVQALRTGLVFASLNSTAALPFLGGTLCVEPPLAKRGPLTFSGGSIQATCTGAFSTVVNSGSVIPLGLDGGAGVSVWYQWWYRDPPNGAGTLGTALSNALRLDFQ